MKHCKEGINREELQGGHTSLRIARRAYIVDQCKEGIHHGEVVGECIMEQNEGGIPHGAEWGGIHHEAA